MRLKEESIFVRWATASDILDDGRLLRWLAEAEARLGGRWLRRRDLAMAGARVFEDAEAFLHTLEGGGFHQRHRVELESASPGLRFRLDAGPHPYTGEWTVRGDLRCRRDGAFDGEPGALSEEADALVRAAASCFAPWVVHAHDVDDSAIQNLEGEAMLRLGYGVDARELPPLEARAGREWNRGAVRLAAEWRTWYAEDTMTKLGMSREEVSGEAVGEGWLFGLGPTCPQAPDAAFRRAQFALRDALALPAIAAQTGWTWGYWDRKSRTAGSGQNGGDR